VPLPRRHPAAVSRSQPEAAATFYNTRIFSKMFSPEIAAIIETAERLAAQLERLSITLDSNIFRVNLASDRGALTGLQNISRDVAALFRRPACNA
jgi:hypothetical protein